MQADSDHSCHNPFDLLRPSDTHPIPLGAWARQWIHSEAWGFKRRRLDRAGFAVASRTELKAWQRHRNKLGVEHSPIADRSYDSVVVFRDPDNLRMTGRLGGPLELSGPQRRGCAETPSGNLCVTTWPCRWQGETRERAVPPTSHLLDP